MAGFDTASYVYDVRVAAVNAFGTPNFWLRYFSPCQTTAFNANWTNATSESRAIWDSGGPKLGAITVPTQSRLSGTTAMGQADAQTLGNSLHNTWLNIGPLQLPTNGQLWCWLDQEPGTGLSLAYWNGWSGTIDGYNWGGSGQLPLYPCMYTDPCNAQPNCSIVGRSDANWCYSIWSYHPSRCSYNNRNPPPWAANTCSGCAPSYPRTPTNLWQYAYPSCGYSPNVDQDLGGGITYGNYCFYLSSRP